MPPIQDPPTVDRTFMFQGRRYRGGQKVRLIYTSEEDDTQLNNTEGRLWVVIRESDVSKQIYFLSNNSLLEGSFPDNHPTAIRLFNLRHSWHLGSISHENPVLRTSDDWITFHPIEEDRTLTEEDLDQQIQILIEDDELLETFVDRTPSEVDPEELWLKDYPPKRKRDPMIVESWRDKPRIKTE